MIPSYAAGFEPWASSTPRSFELQSQIPEVIGRIESLKIDAPKRSVEAVFEVKVNWADINSIIMFGPII